MSRGGGSMPGERRGGRQKGTRNHLTAELKELCRQHTPAAITELIRLAQAAESEQVRVSAIKEILDRGWGRPTQPISGDDDAPPVRASVVVSFVDATGDQG